MISNKTIKNNELDKYLDERFVLFSNCIFKDIVTIKEGRLELLDFTDCTFERGLNIQQSNIDTLLISGGLIKQQLYIYTNADSKLKLVFIGGTQIIGEANFFCNNNFDLNFSEVEFTNHIEIYSESNESLSLLNFYKCIFNQSILFRRLNIKKFGFANNTLNNGFYIENTKILETNLSSYRLIKKMLAENHNFQEALVYHKCEMELLLKTTQKPSEKVLLFLNKISNDHGLNWGRGILFILISIIFFYLMYFGSLKNNPFQFGWNGFSEFLLIIDFHLKHICEFFLVSHKFDFMKQFNPTGLSYLIDFISRIFIGYGIYQAIQAFRKFGKNF